MVVIDYLSLEELAQQLALPKVYLKRLVDTGHIPFLDIGNGRKRFQEKAVREALSRIEQQSLRPKRRTILE